MVELFPHPIDKFLVLANGQAPQQSINVHLPINKVTVAKLSFGRIGQRMTKRYDMTGLP